METIEIDQFSRSSTLYGFDPRVKFAATIALVVALSFMRDVTALIIALAFVLGMLAVSRIPVRHFARVFSLSLPFIAVASAALFLTSGPQPAVAMALRISASVMALLLLVTTTPFFDMLRALRWFRVPYMFCSLLLFTYRYIFVILEELEQMNMARRSRGFSLKGNLFSKDIFRTISFTAGMVLVRSYERSKRIYDGLLARGFRGEIHTLRPPRARPRDLLFLSTFAVTILVISSIQLGLIHWTL
ncbi:MAG: cobalt ECF transporter T component CbiQ [Methanomassiliicoccus sp.]|nr:cobalt ECF transporter T component CbiQ [Methanomassiliicoccus sp.]